MGTHPAVVVSPAFVYETVSIKPEERGTSVDVDFSTFFYIRNILFAHKINFPNFETKNIIFAVEIENT